MSQPTLDKKLLSQMLNGLWHDDTEENKPAPTMKQDTPSLTVEAIQRQEDKLLQEAKQILRRALNNPVLLESIKERACIRWADGRSDSLLDAVLCNLKPLNEKPERDHEGKIIQKPRTDWEAELSNYR